jgi:outer membrane lipoprotein-sorting protein
MNDRKTIKYLVTIMALLTLLTFKGSESLASSGDVHQLINSAIEQFKNISDYTCTLDKKVNKNGTIHEELAIYVKYKKPKHYYFRWNEGRTKGQEVIFVAGKYRDKIVAHSGGLLRFFTLHLDPEGSIAMKKNRHSLKDSGLEKVMHMIETNYILSREIGLDTIKYIGEDRIGETDVLVINGSFPENQGFYAHEIIIALDKELLLPVKVSVYDWSYELIEEYVFRNLRINVGFNECDFDPDNPEYSFY